MEPPHVIPSTDTEAASSSLASSSSSTTTTTELSSTFEETTEETTVDETDAIKDSAGFSFAAQPLIFPLYLAVNVLT